MLATQIGQPIFFKTKQMLMTSTCHELKNTMQRSDSSRLIPSKNGLEGSTTRKSAGGKPKQPFIGSERSLLHNSTAKKLLFKTPNKENGVAGVNLSNTHIPTKGPQAIAALSLDYFNSIEGKAIV